MNLEVILKELLGLANLSRAQVFCIHKIIKVIIISNNKYFMFRTFQILVSYLKSFNNN